MGKRKARRAGEQAAFEFPNGWGGRRKGAGRKPNGDRAGVPHCTRAALASRYPVHVTMRLCAGLPSLRRRGEFLAVEGALRAGCERGGLRLVHFSVQSNHLHLLVEGRDRTTLARTLQGLAVRIARALNRRWTRKGTVFADRYHDHVLRSPREVWCALRYVLNNARKHGGWHSRTRPDPCSSGQWFEGWKERRRTPSSGEWLTRARTWLLRGAWRRYGRIPLASTPGG